MIDKKNRTAREREGSVEYGCRIDNHNFVFICIGCYFAIENDKDSIFITSR